MTDEQKIAKVDEAFAELIRQHINEGKVALAKTIATVFDDLEQYSKLTLFKILIKQPAKKRKHRRMKVCTCADQDFCEVHPTDTDCLDPNGPWGPP